MRLANWIAGLAGLATVSIAPAQTPPATPTPAPTVSQVQVVPPALEPENSWHLDLSTGGRVTVQLRPDAAPQHVERIKTLTRQGFYDGLAFHRVIEGFMAQGGDPTGTGSGGSDLPDLPAEFNTLPHVRGAAAMARTAEPNSANSQFFLMLAPRLTLDGDYTVFGRVISGMSHVDAIARGEPPVVPSRIVRASIGSDNVPELPAEVLIAAGQPPAPKPAAAETPEQSAVEAAADASAPQ